MLGFVVCRIYWWPFESTYISLEVHLDHFEICHWNCRFECGWLLVGLKPFASESFRLVVGFDDVRSVLDYDSVFVELALQVRFGSALIVVDVERCMSKSAVGFHVDAVFLSVSSFGEDNSVKGSRKLSADSHEVLAANHVQSLDFATCWPRKILEHRIVIVRLQ